MSTIVGYGVTKNGKPVGTWPLPYDFQVQTYHRYKKSFPTDEIALVPVLVGKAIELIDAPIATATAAAPEEQNVPDKEVS